MNKFVLVISLIVSEIFANEGVNLTISNSDFIPRLVNFIIFVAILWYLLADKVKNFYANRSNNIAKEFEEIEQKLKDSKAQKEALKAKVEETHKRAEEIIQDAKKEANILKSQILESAKKEVEVLNKGFEDYKFYEKSKLKKEVVKSYLIELTKDIHLTSEEVANIVTKKVG